MYADKVITCADCGREFTFTASEQSFYADRGFTEPRRCGDCRQARKQSRGAGGGSSYGSGSGYSSGSGYTGASYSSGSGYASSGAQRPPREMFEATCTNCGGVARVPFRPTSGKPVYCTDCFSRR